MVLGTSQDDAGSSCCVDGRAQIGHSSTELGIYPSVLDDLTYCSAPGLIPQVQCQQSETLSRESWSSSRTCPANRDGGPRPSGRRNETLFRMGWIRLPSYRTAGFEPATHGPGNRCSIP